MLFYLGGEVGDRGFFVWVRRIICFGDFLRSRFRGGNRIQTKILGVGCDSRFTGWTVLAFGRLYRGFFGC